MTDQVIISPDAGRPEIERLEGELLKREQLEIPVTHTFAPGVYMREVRMPAGAFVIGHCHNTEHLNVVMTGRASVLMEGKVHQIVGPCVIKSAVNVRKVLYIHEDMIWATVHPTQETDLVRLEAELIVKSDAFLEHQEAQKQLEELKQFLETHQPEGGE